MTRPIAAQLERLTPLEDRKPGFGFEPDQSGIVSVQDVSGGMVTATPRQSRPQGSGLVVRNGRVREEWVGRKPGTRELSTAPDANEVRAIIMLRIGESITHIFRITATTIHSLRSSSSTWNALSGTMPTPGNLLVDYAQLFGKLYLAVGIGKIIEIDPALLSFSDVEESGNAKFITTFAERLVAANFPGENGATKIQWSAAAQPLDWTSETAGEENLITSPSDLGDEITGLFSMSREVVLLRERSIWHITRQPFGIAPFRFDPIISDLGCNMPHTAARTPFGIVFADNTSKGVWLYAPGAFPRRLSTSIEDDIFDGITVSDDHQGAYDPFEMEYHLALVGGRRWVYSFKKQAWSFDDSPTISAIGSVVAVPDIQTIDQDVGGPSNFIDGAPVGSVIDDAEPAFRVPSLLYGLSSGEVLEQSFDVVGDFGDAVGAEFQFEFQSQDVGGTSNRRTLKDLILVVSTDAGPSTIEFSKDATPENPSPTWPVTKTLTLAASARKFGFRNRQITGDNLFFRVLSRAARFRMTEFAFKALDKEMKLAI